MSDYISISNLGLNVKCRKIACNMLQTLSKQQDRFFVRSEKGCGVVLQENNRIKALAIDNDKKLLYRGSVDILQCPGAKYDLQRDILDILV